MAVKQEGGALRKRQKIQDSNKMMFLWIAGMSVVVGFCLVGSWFLWQQIEFKTKVVNEKNSTVRTLEGNNKAAIELRDNIRVLETNSALNSAKAHEDQKALQVILDALPAEANSLALGASIQKSLTAGISGLNIERLSVEPTGSEQQTSSRSSSRSTSSSKSTTSNTIKFRLVVNAQEANALRDMLQRFERSIRVIDISKLALERSQTSYTLTLDAHAYYEPAQIIELKKKLVKP